MAQVYNPLTGQMEDEFALASQPQQTKNPRSAEVALAMNPSVAFPKASPQPLSAELASLKPPAVEQKQDEVISSSPVPTTQYIPMETKTTTTTQSIAAPGEAKLEKERQDLLKNQLDNENKSLVLEKEIALAKEQRAKQDADLKAEKQLKLDEQLKLDADNQAKDMLEIKAARDEAKNFKFQDYWADKSTGNKLLAAFSVGLGAFGGSISGSNQNYALDIVNKTIDRDYQMQRDKLEQLNKNAEGVVQGANMNRQVRADSLARLDASYAGKLDSTASMFEQKLASFGVPAAEIASNKTVNQIKSKANEYQTKAEEGKRASRVIQKVNETKEVKPDYTNQDTLRKEYQANPTTKDTNSMRSSIAKINSASDNAQGDLSLIYGFMKVQDPGSVVREGEFATAENSGGLDSKVTNLYNKVVSGERLTKDQRLAFKSEATKILKSQEQVQKDVDSQYSKLSKQRGVNPSDVVMKWEPTKDPAETQEVRIIRGVKSRKVPGGWEEIQ